MKTPAANTVSIRRVLLRWLLVPLIGLFAIAGIQSYSAALYLATQAYDGALVDAALALFNVMVETGNKEELTYSDAQDIMLRTDQFDKIYYSVRNTHTGALIAGDEALAFPSFQVSTEPHFFDSRLAGTPIRVVAMHRTHYDADVVIQVAETTIKRERLFQSTLIIAATSETLMILAAVVVTWLALGKGLEPLQRLRREIEARSDKDLSRVPMSHAPAEVQSVVVALNNLLQQLEASLQAQQVFIADAAHQLRTPLTGLRTQVELGLQQKVPSEWRNTLQMLKPATERATRLANQLLTLARAETNINRAVASSLDLSVVIEQIAGSWMPKAIAKGLDLGLELESTKIRGDAVLIGELVSNLVENAIAYTPDHGRVTVQCMPEGSKAIITVQDNGPGIPEHERQNIFKRFYRLSDSAGDGCGLGLAIVMEIVRLHKGTIEVQTTREGGALFVVWLPLAVEER